MARGGVELGGGVPPKSYMGGQPPLVFALETGSWGLPYIIISHHLCFKEKKKRAREFGKDVTHDSKYTGRKRKVTW